MTGLPTAKTVLTCSEFCTKNNAEILEDKGTGICSKVGLTVLHTETERCKNCFLQAVNYEDVKDLDLGIIVRNKVPLYDGSDGISETEIGLGGGAGGGGSGGGSSGGAGGGSGGGSGGSGGGSGGGTGGSSGGSGGSGGGSGGSGGSSGGSGSGGGASGSPGRPETSWQGKYKPYSIKINVVNEPEGPAFNPKVKAIPISEGSTFNANNVIAHYPAIDGDTGEPADRVR